LTRSDDKVSNADRPRERIVAATFAVLMEKGYAGASTLEIARRARVSKRELYALFGSKSGILETLVSATASRMRLPLTAANPVGRESLRSALIEYGILALAELTSPHVVAIHRLAIAEAGRSSELGKILEQSGREPNRRALVALMTRARNGGLLTGQPNQMAGQFFSLLSGDVLTRLMLGAIRPPRAAEIKQRAEAAADVILRAYAV